MMPSVKLNITVEIPVPFHLSGAPDDEHEVAYPKLRIAYRYQPGAAPTMYARNGDPGDPGWPAEVEFISAELLDGDGLAPTQEQVNHWAEDWLDGDGYEHACEHGEDMRYPDPDDERDRRRDDALTGN
jgi:hypothetical protein